MDAPLQKLWNKLPPQSGHSFINLAKSPIIIFQFGHMVLMSVFSAVDDTKLVSKAIIGEMAEAMADITSTQYGRKVSQLAFHL